MAIVNRRVSDLTGAEAAETEFGKMVVRQHPKLNGNEPKELDFLPDEVAGMKAIAEVVVLELTMPDGTEREVLATPNEFNKLFNGQDVLDVLAKARGTRGRRPKVA